MADDGARDMHLPTYFLRHQSFNIDQKEQNLQIAIADFNVGKFESST